MKVVFVGKGPGKTVTAALLAGTHVVGVYDADPYKALTDLFPSVESYRAEGLITPSLIDTAEVDRHGRPYYHILRENPDAWVVLVSSPSIHLVAATRRILEDVKDLGAAQVLGLVVTMAANEKEALSVAERFGIPLLGWVPLSTAIEDALARGELLIENIKDREVESRVLELGRNLKLQKRAPKKRKEKRKVKRRGLF
jgi:cellulose biosynthesis protein BcsQ